MKTYFAVLAENARYRLLVADDDPDLLKIMQSPPWRLCTDQEAVSAYQNAGEMLTVFLLDTHITISEFNGRPILDWLKQKGLACDAGGKHLLVMYSGEPFENEMFFRAFAKSGDADRDMRSVLNLMNLTASGELDLSLWPTKLPSHPSTEYAQALRLLCEAWLLKNWSQASSCAKRDELRGSLQLNSGEVNWLRDIPLTPPDSKEEWMAPFGSASVGDITNKMPTGESKRLVRELWTCLERGTPEFAQVADLFLLLDQEGKGTNT